MSLLGAEPRRGRAVRIGWRRVAPLAVVLIALGAAAATAVLLAAGFTQPPQTESVASSGGGSCTLTGTTTAPGGTLTVCARYGISGAGRVRLESVLASYRSPDGYSGPYFTVTLIDGVTGVLDDRRSGPARDGDAVQSYRSDFTAFRVSFRAPETMIVTLMDTTYGPNRPFKFPLASVALVLGRPFPCPDPGMADNRIPAC
jgi:hypothetical protein